MAAPRDDLLALARACGILPGYLARGGEQRMAGSEALLAVLASLGHEAATRDPASALRAHRASLLAPLLEPVIVVGSAEAERVPLRLPVRAEGLDCRLLLEDGGLVEWRASLGELDPHDEPELRALGLRAASLPLPWILPAGYHQLEVASGRARTSSQLLARPSAGARGRFGEHWRALGISAPLFSLHSAHSWGCGDLSDLDELGRFAAEQRIAVVSTLPLLAGFGSPDFEASPYRPISRRFWHERWIDVDRAAPAVAGTELSSLLDEARSAARLAALQRPADAEGALQAKRRALRAIFDHLGDRSHGPAQNFRGFLEGRPEALDYGRFLAVGAQLGRDWRRWPAAMRGGGLRAGDAPEEEARFHAFLQWLAHEQLTGVAESFERRGQVLSLDLPLGSHPLGYDVWCHQEQYARGVAVGAPPDHFFPGGQEWGFPPLLPEAARADGHRQLRAALQHHLNVAGLLRIDHILGFERLFWVPEGMSPAEGVYVRSPREELMAVVAIEAQRHRADIVGEDLGTVDPVVREAMDRDGVRRSFAGQLSFVPGPEVLAEPPRGSVASFSTHDLPTFLGWWEGRDIVEREELGQVDAATARLMAAERDEERRRLVALLPFEDQGVARLTEPPAGMVEHLTGLLAKSGAGLVMVQVSDLLLERDAVNLPGTSIERPNWLQRWALSLEEIEADPSLRSSLAALQSQFEEAGPQPGRGGREVSMVYGVTRLSEVDDHLFNEGRHFRLYDKLGAHLMLHDGVEGCYFAVWAPNASGVEVAGDFNGWDSGRHPLERHGTTGIWEGFIPGAVAGQRYMYRLTSGVTGEWLEKADPLARQCELPPRTASIISSLDHVWRDERWMEARAELQSRAAPISIYELHLESFRRVPEEGDRPLSYRELAPHLISHVQSLGFTHVELMPVMEYPFSGSWGYQVTGYFAPSSRFGTEEDFAWLIDELHQAGIGVILDWVPAHFPADAFALARFDGTHLYEHADVRQGFHPDWNSLIFNFGRHEVRNFLISSACCWLDRFHVDGLRFDAVASMLYLDYSRAPGEWIPNRYGGRENLDAVELLRSANLELHRSFPGALSIAEESTAWPGVTRPVEEGGLGFDYKWDLGWMHDTLDYLERDPIHRHWHHDQLTFRSLYVKSEHFVLPLSHDEVVHGKGSLLAKMPGDRWQQLANLRLLFGFQLSQPGKKLLFMGDEFAQPGEWDHSRSLDWHLLEHTEHLAMARYVAELGALYRSRPPLHRDDLPDGGFRWIDGNDRAQSVLCIERHDGGDGHLVIVLNATPTPRHGYRVGMPLPGRWELVLDSDEPRFGGSGTGAPAVLEADGEPWHDRPQSALLSLPPLGLVIYGSSNGGIAGAN